MASCGSESTGNISYSTVDFFQSMNGLLPGFGSQYHNGITHIANPIFAEYRAVRHHGILESVGPVDVRQPSWRPQRPVLAGRRKRPRIGFLAWGWGLRRVASSKASGTRISAVKWAVPQALIMADGLGWLIPSALSSPWGRTASGLMSPFRKRAANKTASMILVYPVQRQRFRPEGALYVVPGGVWILVQTALWRP